MRLARVIPILFAVLTLGSFTSPTPIYGEGGPALGQETKPKDHPRFSGMPSYEISNLDEQEFGAGEFDIGGGQPRVHVEGKYWQIDYSLKEGAKKAGPLQIGRNYTAILLAKGGKKLFEELDASGGATTGTMPIGNGRSLWLQVNVNNTGEIYNLMVVEEADMKQDVAFTAGDLAEALKTKGSIAVHNILFDTGKATIKPESAGVLAVIADTLKSDATLKIEIQGHTDNVGAAAANLKLSQDRAAAVKAYLVQTGGIAAARLTTAGLGDTTPIADNKTDEGRAQNRRVELVRK
jgi:outer membrane protein OmpA-like peptidoglycan-associated protein